MSGELTAAIPLSDSIYAWILGIAMAAALPFIHIVRQCNDELRDQIKQDIETASKKNHNSDFYLEMFHLSRRYHSQDAKIKYICVSFSGIILASAAGLVYHQQWYEFDVFYAEAALVLSGIFFVVNFTPLAWRFIKCHWQ